MNISDNQYFVNEIFQSIQGEGNSVGINSLFIRFQFCNLSCSWCDTKYTWLSKNEEYRVFNTEELYAIIDKSPSINIIFTGGEPAIYRLDSLYSSQRKFHVETNGTIYPTEPFKIRIGQNVEISRAPMDEQIISQYNWIVSPKINETQPDILEKNLKFWGSLPYATFKFIVSKVEDIDRVDFWVKKCNLNNQKIYIGLEGITRESQIQPEVIDAIIKKGYNFSPRLHILIWGNERGR
jgi:organic radical activating enzyme